MRPAQLAASLALLVPLTMAAACKKEKGAPPAASPGPADAAAQAPAFQLKSYQATIGLKLKSLRRKVEELPEGPRSALEPEVKEAEEKNLEFTKKIEKLAASSGDEAAALARECRAGLGELDTQVAALAAKVSGVK